MECRQGVQWSVGQMRLVLHVPVQEWRHVPAERRARLRVPVRARLPRPPLRVCHRRLLRKPVPQLGHLQGTLLKSENVSHSAQLLINTSNSFSENSGFTERWIYPPMGPKPSQNGSILYSKLYFYYKTTHLPLAANCDNMVVKATFLFNQVIDETWFVNIKFNTNPYIQRVGNRPHRTYLFRLESFHFSQVVSIFWIGDQSHTLLQVRDPKAVSLSPQNINEELPHITGGNFFVFLISIGILLFHIHELTCYRFWKRAALAATVRPATRVTAARPTSTTVLTTNAPTTPPASTWSNPIVANATRATLVRSPYFIWNGHFRKTRDIDSA